MMFSSMGHVVIALAMGAGSATWAIPRAALTQQPHQISMTHEMAPVGFGLNQTLRYTWANQATPDLRDRFEPLRVAVRLLADDGTVLAQDSAEAVSPGRFQVFDFSRGAITRSGDATTARLQVRVEVTVVGPSKYPIIELKRGKTDSFDDAGEIIDQVTGATVVAFGRGANELTLDDTAGKEYSVRDGHRIILAGNDGLIGLAPGQSLRLTAAHPVSRSEQDREFTHLFAFTIFDAVGRVLVEGTEIELPPGQSQSFEVPYPALSTAAGATGRMQVRVAARRIFHGPVSRISQGGSEPIALEIIDPVSGRTVVHMSQKPKEIVVVGSQIEP